MRPTVIICYESAWQYWRTPPLLRDGWINPAALDAELSANSPERRLLAPARSNARDAGRLVHSRLLGDLKGISLPVHVMVDDASSRHATDVVVAHRMPRNLPEGEVVDLGNGLGVLSSELTVLLHERQKDPIEVAKMMFEACGLFSLVPSNPRIDLVLAELVENGRISAQAYANKGIYGYCDSSGFALPTACEEDGLPLWVPSFDRYGCLTNLWKHSPLSSVEQISKALDGLEGVRGLPAARRALRAARDGAASPAEVFANLLLCSGAWMGGESWGDPDLNRQVPYAPSAKALAHSQFGVADMLWPDSCGDLEIQGKDFHADDLGFALASGRRAAFESMGYTVSELTWEQMADLELFDAVLPVLSRQLGFGLQERTPAFLRRRDELHRALFEAPYDED